jgi:hypothetical protein
VVYSLRQRNPSVGLFFEPYGPQVTAQSICLVVAGRTTYTRVLARSTPTTGSADGVTGAVASFANGREQRDGAGGVGIATLSTRRRIVRPTHGAELLKGCVAISAMILINRHCLDPHGFAKISHNCYGSQLKLPDQTLGLQ